MKFFLGYVMLFCMGMLTSTSANPTEFRLKSKLLGKYGDKRLLPPMDMLNGSREIRLGMSLTNLKGLDFFTGTLQMNGWLKMLWNDIRLSWDPSDYENITILRFHSSDIWIPDITLYNSHSPSESLADVSALIYSDGTVYYLPPMSIEAACDLDLRDYPYDSHSCRLKLGWWVYDNSRISLQASSEKINLEDYWAHAMWDLTSTSAAHNVIPYPCCEEVYEDISFHLTLRRRETHGHIASSVITAWLILIVFLIRPSSAGERIVFAGFVFVALVVLSAALSAEIPAYSVTRLGRFLIGGMLITAVVTVINGLIYRFHPKNQPGNLKEGEGSPPRLFLFIDIGAFLGTAIILAISTGALFA